MPHRVAPTGEKSTTQLRPSDLEIDKKSDDKIKLKKQLGLWDGVGIIIGIIVGSGIFVSPIGVLKNSRSVGQSLIIWTCSGLMSLIGALCYAELGTMIPKSGGDYAYINDTFGPLPAFLYLWIALLILVPAGNAITALTFAENIIASIRKDCEDKSSYFATRLLATVVTCLLTAINCYNVKWATRVQGVFAATKIFAFLTILGVGSWWLYMGNTENFSAPMDGSATQPNSIALAVYAGLFSYSGWNYLNYVTEELKDPYKNLPRAICISVPMITVFYVLINVSYFIVLTTEEILSSNAVAVTFGNKSMGNWSWVIPIFVACSTFGALNGAIFTSARLFFVGARNGHFPNVIAQINVEHLTPTPSLIFLCIITVALMFVENIMSLIYCASFVESVFIALSVAGLLWLRYHRPDLHRPIKVPLILPITFFVICMFLVFVPMVGLSREVFVGSGVIVSGVPVYLIFIQWKNKPKWLLTASYKFNTMSAKLFMCVEETN